MKGYLKKGIACFIFLFSISMSLSFVSALEGNDEVKMNDVVEVKNGLYKENGKVYFYENDVAITGIVNDNGTFYYVNADGNVKIGWVNDQNHWYFVNNDATCKQGWYKYYGKWYYLDANDETYPSSAITNQAKEINGIKYHFDENGAIKTGWINDDDHWYFYDGNASLVSGWYKYYGKWYYLDANDEAYPYAAITNQVREINGVKYTFDENGAIKTGWMLDGNDWYYYDQNGNKCTGWVYVKNQWYLLNDAGVMQTGWQRVSGKWYYLDESGQGYMYTGWLDLNGQWYYLNAYGSMLTGWINVKGTWYYMDASGAMCTGWKQIAGTWYYLHSGGNMAIGWLKDNNQWYYLNSSGAMLHDTYFEAFYFTSSGALRSDSVYDSMTSRASGYSSATNYLILVDTANCRVAIYQGSVNNWNNIHYYSCAPGKASTPTVKGEFTVGIRGYYFDSGSSRCFWYTQFKGNYLFHSTLYNKNGTIQDNRTGIPLSHGCVRLEIQYAKWIYDNIPSGTKVVVF